jgi:RimJ/RimL family protein N-acetyltransferase
MVNDYIDELRSAFPVSGSKMELRLFTRNHVTTEYLGWLRDPEVLRYSNQRFKEHDKKSSLAYLRSFQKQKNLFLAIHLLATGGFVGTVTTYFSVQHQTADIGLMVGDKSVWGRGIGSDAWLTLIQLLMHSRRIRKITGGTVRSNTGMVRIMLKAGMLPDGVRVGQELVDGLPEDILYFALFRNE